MTSLELQRPTFPDAPTQVVAEEDQALGKVEADQEHPQARDLLAQARRGSATTSSEESGIGATSANTSTKLDRRRRSHERSTSPACTGKRANVIKGTSACSGTMVLRVNKMVHPDHQATPPSAATPAKDGKPRSPSPAPKRRPSRGRSRSKEKTRTAPAVSHMHQVHQPSVR